MFSLNSLLRRNLPDGAAAGRKATRVAASIGCTVEITAAIEHKATLRVGAPSLPPVKSCRSVSDHVPWEFVSSNTKPDP